MSKKKAQLDAEYRRLKAVFLADHPYCQHFMAENGIDEEVAINNMGIVLIKQGSEWTWITVPRSSEVHHKRGRGEFYLDVTTWMACRPGHSIYIHGDPKTAYEKGYMIPR